ncbi:MAG: hypothetical protein RL748_1400, partial [Pseudomonadota bacterium]
MGNTTINISGSTVHGNVTSADLIQNSFNQTNTAPAKAAAPANLQGAGTVKIFLASSEELRAERDNFELFLRQQNDHYQEQGTYLKIVRWENFLDAMSATRLQDEYNQAVRECDIFVSLFATKTGKYTEEEFDTAHKQFLASGRPYIYTFFKDAALSTGSADRQALQSLWAFQDRLKALGH